MTEKIFTKYDGVDSAVLREGERAVFRLRSLYQKYGYLPYKMSKFEEYELYARNKDFLVSDRIITFNDTNGKLMALKPDVTLSIVRSTEEMPGQKKKVYYNENVYRVSESTHRYKEIMQAGVECIGDIDLYDIYESITLAAASLAMISDQFVLEVSHLGFLSYALSLVCKEETFREEALKLFSKKNAHDLQALCGKYGISAAQTKALCALLNGGGERRKMIDTLEQAMPFFDIREIRQLSELLDASPYSDRICFDFSVVNDMNYYSGFVFRGFIEGIYQSVLAGGQYDGMMRKMGKNSGAVGFAIYLDLLERLETEHKENDIDILLLYDEKVDFRKVVDEVALFQKQNLRVSAQKQIPEKVKYGQIIDLRNLSQQNLTQQNTSQQNSLHRETSQREILPKEGEV